MEIKKWMISGEGEIATLLGEHKITQEMRGWEM
jgi:hypothetical protein